MKKWTWVVLFVSMCIKGIAQDTTGTYPLISTQTDNPPIIDGDLSDEIWNSTPNLDEFFTTYSPVNGDSLPERTRVWVSNDKENLYFAFYCHDSRPDQIKNSITKHDEIWNDDWIGFNLDPLGNKTFGYVLVTNPSGIQADIFDSPVAGSDGSPDYVWYSAGKMLDDGYSVEIQVPLKNFKYKSGSDVGMNIIFERKVSRLSLAASWPAVPVGQTFFAGMSEMIIPELESQVKLQAIPSLTYHNSWNRVDPDSWSKGNGKADLGISARYGITSTISAEATINPDFSHIESDAFQVLINQRYPIYYSEKRTFFMETANAFNIAGGNLGGKALISSVHTRNIVDPLWGAKIVGDHKRWSFGLLSSGDKWPGREFTQEIDGTGKNPFQDLIATYNVGRAKYILKGETQVGAIISDREFAGGYNRVLGADLNLRLGEGNHWIRSNLLSSYSKDENTLERSNGMASNVAYNYITRQIEVRADYEYIDPDFEMATAFIKRTGISKLTGMLWINFYPRNENLLWIKKITPVIYANILQDLVSKEYDYNYKGGVNFNFTKQGSLRIEYEWFQEFWEGENFDGRFFNTYGQVQITNWLRTYGKLTSGDRIYYSLTDPFVGTGLSADIRLTIQPNTKLTQLFEYQIQNLFRKSNREKMYDVNILISNTIYQLNRHLFFRAILQYDSYRETVLGDVLVSYELVPGTVFQLGYGSLFINQYWEDNQWIKYNPAGEYYNTDQSVFVKLSYLFQY